MSYIEGFVAAAPADSREAYVEYAKRVWAIFRDHGALEMTECWGDDVPDGKLTSFPLAVQCGDDEVVVFSWTRWASKEARDKGWEAIEKDPRMSQPAITQMPFDGKRMIFGGFQPVVELKA